MLISASATLSNKSIYQNLSYSGLMFLLPRFARGVSLVLISGALYGGLGILGTSLMATFSIATMSFWRFLIASICLVTWCLWRDPQWLREWRHHWRALFSAMLFGAIFYAPSSAAYFMVCRHLGTGLSMVIFYTYPAFVALYSWTVMRHQVIRSEAMAMLGILIGCSMIADYSQASISFSGLALGLISALSYAAYILASHRWLPTAEPMVTALGVCLGGMLMYSAYAYGDHSWRLPNTGREWLEILALAFISTALPIMLLLEGMKHVSANKASILSVMEPVTIILIGVILLHETASLIQWVGVVCVLTSAVMIAAKTTATTAHET
jgi:drug/metabolite transporter (DMT)-like permease